MSDIARCTGYSVNTVSHALNGIDDVRESTKKLILSTAKKLGYIPNSAAISMRNGRTMAVAAIIPDITGLYFPIMVKLLENRLRALGYDLIIMNTSENPDQELQCVTSALSKNVDGVIICPSMHNCDALDLMERHGVPFVLMGRYFRDRSYESVVADDFRSGYLLTDHMIGLGHTKIAYIGASTHVSSSAERLEGYRAALSAQGIVPDDRLVRICMTPEDITAAAVEIAEHRLDCTSVFGFCDMFCWHIASILAGHGIRIPDGISMGGVDDLRSHIIFPFDLTSVDCPKEQMADCVIKSLFSRIGGDGAKSIRHIIEPTLVVRTSVKSLYTTLFRSAARQPALIRAAYYLQNRFKFRHFMWYNFVGWKNDIFPKGSEL